MYQTVRQMQVRKIKNLQICRKSRTLTEMRISSWLPFSLESIALRLRDEIGRTNFLGGIDESASEVLTDRVRRQFEVLCGLVRRQQVRGSGFNRHDHALHFGQAIGQLQAEQSASR